MSQHNTDQPPRTLSVTEAAELLGISRGVAYQAARRGEIVGVPVLTVGRRFLIPRVPLMQALGLDAEDPTS